MNSFSFLKKNVLSSFKLKHAESLYTESSENQGRRNVSKDLLCAYVPHQGMAFYSAIREADSVPGGLQDLGLFLGLHH